MNTYPSAEELSQARILWDYHRISDSLTPADFVLAMGSQDDRVAECAAKLILNGMAPLLVTSGGFGKVTRDTSTRPEGERFAEVAMRMGVDQSNILIDAKATNTGENLANTRNLLTENAIRAARGILVTKPYMCRRAYATASKQWPEIEWQVTAPNISFEDYPTEEIPVQRVINLMVGDLQRMKVYADKGLQSAVDIPPKVWKTYEMLRDAGYDDFVIKDS
ncbi:MAG: YdcF family protein [Bauldia sp.]